MQLWQASLLSAAVHAGILLLPARDPPAPVERKKPREVQLVKLPPAMVTRAEKTRMPEAPRSGTPGLDRVEIAPSANSPPTVPKKASPVQRTVAEARRVVRSSARFAAAPRQAQEPLHPADRPRNPPVRPRETPPLTGSHPLHPPPPKITTRTLSAPDGTTVVARLSRTVLPKGASPPAPSRHDPVLDFTLGHPAPLGNADPGVIRSGRPGEGVLGVGEDIGTVTVTVGNGGGDVSPRLLLIQKRIDSVVAMLRSARRDCPGAKGVVRIEFQIQPNGYPSVRRLRASLADPCLEEKAGAVIHLAEPYPYVSGWVPVTMDFN